ncbi:4'-phosphopantetheinyl transferase family protein [Robiginitalea aurantiaca]|uniref:4'-phosphopantetheinyl transferase superfamily protein n=1 Tax=Robiginitalea aurantiaca TaxID=3056915 RepID=A0ABT7WBK5_9FLAO|nr:4'-phosphopantetheinyl transferase superfamily protein [Robiginitalea aurantiaca]MDM9630302.1 4'-phosphopantetheinyl transferase superfamily protein [Robiginitalea aurantiaca]
MSSLFCQSTEITESGKKKLKQDGGSGILLFKVELKKYYSAIATFLGILDDDELQRAHRYHFLKDKNRFIICRAFLKMALSKTTGTNLSDIRIDTGHNKKPVLSSHPDVFFNVSHSGQYALIAIGDKPVGVDVERVNREFDFSDIKVKIFNPKERQVLDFAADTERQFYEFWTRKEAVLKATGKGIDDDFAQIPATDGFHELESGILGKASDFVVMSFEVDAEHMGAIAIEGRYEEFSWNPLYTPLPIF